MAKLEKKYVVIKTKHRDGKTYESSPGTISELVKYYSYSLETGESYQHEKGNKKINTNPKNIGSLIKNLDNSGNNAARDGYSGYSFSYKEL